MVTWLPKAFEWSPRSSGSSHPIWRACNGNGAAKDSKWSDWVAEHKDGRNDDHDPLHGVAHCMRPQTKSIVNNPLQALGRRNQMLVINTIDHSELIFTHLRPKEGRGRKLVGQGGMCKEARGPTEVSKYERRRTQTKFPYDGVFNEQKLCN